MLYSIALYVLYVLCSQGSYTLVPKGTTCVVTIRNVQVHDILSVNFCSELKDQDEDGSKLLKDEKSKLPIVFRSLNIFTKGFMNV